MQRALIRTLMTWVDGLMFPGCDREYVIDAAGDVALRYMEVTVREGSRWSTKRIPYLLASSPRAVACGQNASKRPAIGPARALPLVVYLHGNAENIGDCVWSCSYLSDVLGLRVVCPEYPGYGEYAGRANDRTVQASLEVFASELVDRGYTRIVLVGRSIGSCLAARLGVFLTGMGVVPDGIVLDSPFVSFKHWCRSAVGAYTGLSVPTWALPFRQRLDVGTALSYVTCPVLILCGDRDTVIPHVHGQALHESSDGGRVELVVFAGADHNLPTPLSLDVICGWIVRKCSLAAMLS